MPSLHLSETVVRWACGRLEHDPDTRGDRSSLAVLIGSGLYCQNWRGVGKSARPASRGGGRLCRWTTRPIATSTPSRPPRSPGAAPPGCWTASRSLAGWRRAAALAAVASTVETW